MFRPVLVAAIMVVMSPAVRGQADEYHVTAYEKAACASDAMRLCSDTYPDEGRLLNCMKANRSSLHKVCKVAFNTGLRRRHIE